MNKAVFLVFILTFLVGCDLSAYTFLNPELSFEKGIGIINEMDERYGSSIKSPPESAYKIDKMLGELNDLRAKNMAQSLSYFTGFKTKFLEAEKLHAEGWQWGRASTTKYGFGCKGYGRIKESASLRLKAAERGDEAVEILQKFVAEYPVEAEIVELSQKDALLLNAIYFQIKEDAERDNAVIESACGQKGD